MSDLVKLRMKIADILTEKSRPDGGKHYQILASKKLSSKFVPVPFKDIILAHNDTETMVDFALAVEQVYGQELDVFDLQKWCNRIRMAISKWRSSSDDDKTLSDTIGVTIDEIDNFMKFPKRPDKISRDLVVRR